MTHEDPTSWWRRELTFRASVGKQIVARLAAIVTVMGCVVMVPTQNRGIFMFMGWLPIVSVLCIRRKVRVRHPEASWATQIEADGLVPLWWAPPTAILVGTFFGYSAAIANFGPPVVFGVVVSLYSLVVVLAWPSGERVIAVDAREPIGAR